MATTESFISSLNQITGTSPWTRVLVVDGGGLGDYTSIKSACDYVATQSPTASTTWLIAVKPGKYAEDAFTVPAYTVLAGEYTTPSESGPIVEIVFTNTVESGTCITMETFSSLLSLNIIWNFGTQTGEISLVEDDGTDPIVTIQNVLIQYLTVTDDINGIKTSGGTLVLVNVLLACYHVGVVGRAVFVTGNAYFFAYGLSTFPSPSPVASSQLVYSSSAVGWVRASYFRTSQAGEYDIVQTAGTLRISNTTYQSCNLTGGTLIHDDRTVSNDAEGTWRPNAASQAILILKGVASQTGLPFQVQDNSGNIKFSIEPDGDIRTSQSAAATNPGSVQNKLEIFDAAGNSLGFVALYDAIT